MTLYSRNRAWLTLVSTGVFIFYALMFAIPSGYSYGAGLLLLTSLAYLATWPRWNLSTEDKAIACLLAAVFLVSLIVVLAHGDKLKMLDQTSRCLLLIPVLLLMLKVPPRLSALWASLAIGAVSAVAIALWQNLTLDILRPSGFMTSAIPFGGLALTTGMLCLAGLSWAHTQGRYVRIWQLALAIGFLAGLYTSFISGSRGGWLAIPVVLTLFCIAFLTRKNLKKAAVSAVLVVAAIGVVGSALQSEIKTRYDEAVSEISQYVQHRNASTSIGIRLEAWRSAMINIAEKPVLGWSYEDYAARLQEQAAEGVVKESITELANTHNNYVEVWLHQGIFGLLALLALYVVPFWFFCKRLRSGNVTVQALAVGGASLLASFFVFGLTQVILGRNNGILFFALTLVVFWACLRHEEQKAQAQEAAGAV